MKAPLPTWEDAACACTAGAGTPVERLVYDHEPAGAEDEQRWRAAVQAALEHVAAGGCTHTLA